MKKIGVVTLNGYFNYGNRLQNYALQETLKQLEFKVETIWIGKSDKQGNDKSIFAKILKDPKILLRKAYKELYLNPLNKKRQMRFKEFSRKYINETNYKISDDYLPKQLCDFDFFVTGSDQVWNPYFTNSSSLYFLTFVPNYKRIAYAPSFGVSELPEFCKDDFSKWLSEMGSLSVREDAGARIIKKLTDRDAEVVADPTLLLTKTEWLSVAKPASNKPKEEYLLTYFLGAIPREIKQNINNYAKKYKLKIIDLAQPKVKKFYLTDPAEFLDFINSATLFFTDSFHGTVFSILFETPFVITDRKSSIPSMNSRIQTLLSTYKFENRHISRINENELFDMDFTQVETILTGQRKKAISYLEGSLKS